MKKEILVRLQVLMDKHNLTPSVLANEINVSRAALSHIMAGRNNPSTEVIIKLLNRFQDIDANWLLTGKGEEPKVDKSIDEKSMDNQADKGKTSKFTNVNRENKEHQSQISPAPKDEDIKINSKEDKNIINNIILFYSDGSFKSFDKRKD